MADIDKPLAGITVIELGHSVAAPYAGLILADLGARVIKVENPGSGDYARGRGPPFWKETSSIFLGLNRGKEGITVDFGDPRDCENLRSLIRDKADAVIQNLRPGILEKFGLTADALRVEKPSLIWCDIGAFGATGPLASKPGYDPLAQASTGIMSVTGEGGRPPVRVGVSLVDMGSGMWAVIGMLAALVARNAGGRGRSVATSLYETGLAWMTVPLAGYAASGEVRKPYGSGTAEIAPYQAFEASDGWLMIAAGNDNLFRKLCGALGLEVLASDPDFATNAARVVNRERLIPANRNGGAALFGRSARQDSRRRRRSQCAAAHHRSGCAASANPGARYDGALLGRRYRSRRHTARLRRHAAPRARGGAGVGPAQCHPSDTRQQGNEQCKVISRPSRSNGVTAISCWSR